MRYLIVLLIATIIGAVSFVATQPMRDREAHCEANGGCHEVTKAELAKALTEAYVIGHTHGEQTCKAGT